MHIELISNAIHTYWLVIVIAACAVAGMLFAANGGFGWPYTAKPLLTNPEQVVFRRLRQAFPDLVVLAQVSLSQAVAIRTKGKAHGKWFGKVSAKSLDFVLCRHDFSIVAAVELDDKTHEAKVQRQRDADKDRVLAAAKIPLLRWRVNRMPTVSDMQDQVRIAVAKSSAAASKS